MLKITHEEALQLLNCLGIKNAQKLSLARLEKKFPAMVDSALDDDIDEDQINVDTDDLLNDVVSSLDAEEEIKIVEKTDDDDDWLSDDDNDNDDDDDEDNFFGDDDDDEEEEEAKPSKPTRTPKKKTTRPKRGRPKKKAAAKKDDEITGKRITKKKITKKKQNVRKSQRSRFYLAGGLIAKHGRERGITDDMVAELNELNGEENQEASMFALQRAWHVVGGFASYFNGDYDLSDDLKDD